MISVRTLIAVRYLNGIKFRTLLQTLTSKDEQLCFLSEEESNSHNPPKYWNKIGIEKDLSNSKKLSFL